DWGGIKTHEWTGNHVFGHPYKCDVTECLYETYSGDELVEHIESHGSIYPCESVGCSATFSTADDMAAHMATHDQELRVRCRWPGCNKSYRSTYHMNKHMDTHSRETVYRCQWSGCEKAFANKRSVRDHERRHKGVKSGRYRCHWPQCEYRSSNADTFRRHFESHKNEAKSQQRVDRHAKGRKVKETFGATYFQYCPLKLTAQESAQLLSTVATAFTVGRGLSVLMALRFKPQQMIGYHFAILIIAAITLYAGQYNLTVLWVSTIMAGLGLSAMCPAMFAYLEQYLSITNPIGVFVERYSWVVLMFESIYVGTCLLLFVSFIILVDRL
ncbi:unnamed protein product, partial [Oppiella nova]